MGHLPIVRSRSEQRWRALEPLVAVALLATGLAWLAEGLTTSIVVMTAVLTGLLVLRHRDWRHCGDLWDHDGELQVRCGDEVVARVAWSSLAALHFSYRAWPPQWYMAKFVPALPGVRLHRQGQEPDSPYSMPAFADLLLLTRASRREADLALQEACREHGVLLRSPLSPGRPLRLDLGPPAGRGEDDGPPTSA